MRQIFILVPFILILIWAIYLLLPHFLVWIEYIKPQNKPGPASAGKQNSLSRIHQLVFSWQQAGYSKIRRAGFDAKRALSAFILIGSALFTFGFAAAWLNGWRVLICMVSGSACVYLLVYWLNLRIEKRKESFDRALYKIYRFLNMQISSGIKVTDAIRGLPEAVHDTYVKSILTRFSAVYELTYDLDQAAKEIHQAFGGQDAHMLIMHLHQAVKSGETGKSLLRMEELLFSRYFSHLQAESQRYKNQLIWIAVIGLIPIAAIILFPILSIAGDALQLIFG